MRKLLWAFMWVAACSSSTKTPMTELPPSEVPAGCNPVVGDDCLTPFPTAFYEAVDATSATGVRVALAQEALPVDNKGTPLSAGPFNGLDGFSPATPFIVYLASGVDGAALPTPDTLDVSVTAQSTVQVIEAATGQRVPVMAELDTNAVPDAGDRQALLIRPMTRLHPAARYVIALVGLNDAAGQPIAPERFRALRDGTTLSPQLEAQKARYEEIFGVLEQAGVARAKVGLAWDVITASDETATGNLVRMRDEALTQVPSLTWSLTDTTPASSSHVLRQLKGTFQVPWYLDRMDAQGRLATDASGAPSQNGLGSAKIVVQVPACAATATAPLPILVYGHGLFGSADNLTESGLAALGDQLCMVQVATDWIGFTTSDVATIGKVVLADLNNIDITTSQLQQAQLNTLVMTRLVKTRLKDDPLLQLDGKPFTDGSEVYFLGISAGGIEGGTYLALTQDVNRGVLNVAGCEWSLLMFRSYDFKALQTLLSGLLPDYVDQQVAIALSQSLWDKSDPASFAPHLIADPLPGTPVKQVLLQESIGDAVVSNVATRVLARTIGLPGNALVQPVFGVEVKPAPLESAYTQWDVHATPVPPPGDTPPAQNNGAHDGIQGLPELVDQLQAFLKADGHVIQTCESTCSFNN